MPTTQYRAVLHCRQDPCSYCRTPARTFLASPAVPGITPGKTHVTVEEAYEHGRAMASKVYGSEHYVSVHKREVGDWSAVDMHDA